MSNTNSGQSQTNQKPEKSGRQQRQLGEQQPVDEERTLKIKYEGPDVLEFKIGTLAKFWIKIVNAPPSSTICFELEKDKTGEKRDLIYLKKKDCYKVLYVLMETGGYHISVKVNGESHLAIPTIGLDNESATESLIETTKDSFKMVKDAWTGIYDFEE